MSVVVSISSLLATSWRGVCSVIVVLAPANLKLGNDSGDVVDAASHTCILERSFSYCIMGTTSTCMLAAT